MPSTLHSPAHAADFRDAESITSRDNRWLKRFRAALAGETARGASAAGEALVGVEGARLVEAALRSGVEIVALLASEAGQRHAERIATLAPAEARLLRTSDRLFEQVAATEAPQGIAALVRPRAAVLDDLVRGMALVVILAGVQDPGNVGALVRTAEAFGATGLAACSEGATGTANPFGPKALRASAGSALRLPILRGVSAPVLLAQLRLLGIRTYAACPEATGDDAARKHTLAPWKADWRAPSALLIGNEGAGLSAELVRSADAAVRIPQVAAEGRIESLNAGIAGSILLYEAARQRGLH